MGGYSASGPISSPGREPPTQCEGKCETDYDEAALGCGKIRNEEAHRKCDDRAYTTYRSCLDGCKHLNGDPDCLEQCLQLCDQIHDTCHAGCNRKRSRKDKALCHIKCNNEYKDCLRKCHDKCK